MIGGSDRERSGSEGLSHDDGLVGRLVRLAEHGPQAPDGGADRIKRAIRPAWRAEVRARRRRRAMLWGGGALAAAASVVLGLAVMLADQRPTPEAPQPVARVVALGGSMEIMAPDGPPALLGAEALGIGVVAGSWLGTGPTSRVALQLGGGQSLRLDGDTRVRLVSARFVDLCRGAVYVDSDGAAGAGLEVRTGLGLAREIGTQFEVRQDGQTLIVRVREGSVALARNDTELMISHGTELHIAADGTHETRRILSHGAEWDWVQEVAPPFEIEGRSVLAFLDWVSRETGLWLRFADPGVERMAETTVLHGTIDGLSPSEAPAVVLPGCGLAGTVDAGSLVIRRQGMPDGGR